MKAEQIYSDSMVYDLLEGRGCCYQLVTLSEAFDNLEHLNRQVVYKQMRSLTSARLI